MRSLRRRSRAAEDTGATAATASTIATAQQDERTRRRFARRQWRRRWLAWRYVVAVVVVLVVAAAGIWAAYFSSWLSVKDVDVKGVSGGTTLTASQVRRTAAVPTGGSLLRADLSAIRHRVAALAPVKSVEVSREWPSKVRIDVVERTAVAVIEIGGRLRALDGSGVVFSAYRHAPSGLPRITTTAGTDTEALRQGAEVASALPSDLRSAVDHVEVASIDKISLDLASGKVVAWGSAADSDTKAEVLAALMKAQPKAHTYDVSVPGQPVTAG